MAPEDLNASIKDIKNPTTNNLLKELRNLYPLEREVRGDGNSFYKAVFFLLFEYILQMDDYTYLDNLTKKVREVCPNLMDICTEESLKENARE